MVDLNNSKERRKLEADLLKFLGGKALHIAGKGIKGTAEFVRDTATSKWVKGSLRKSGAFLKTKQGKVAGALVGLALTFVGIKLFSSNQRDDLRTNNQEFFDQANENLVPQYVDSRQDFDKILDRAKDLLPMTWYLHEALVKGPYSDTGKKDAPDNSQGFGIYNDPNFDMKKVLELCKNNKRYRADITDALTSYYIKSMLDWFEKQENGKFYQNMYSRLQGCKITPLQITALMSIYYNNPAKGIQAMNKFKEVGAEGCASFVLDMKCDPQFQNGIDHRRMIEIGLLLNSKKLLENLPRFTIRVSVDENNVERNSAGNVSIFSKNDIEQIKNELRRGDQTTFWKKFNQYCDEGTKGNGTTIAEALQKDAPLYALGMFRCPDTVTYQARGEEIIACAAEYYTNTQDIQGMEQFGEKYKEIYGDMPILSDRQDEVDLTLATMNLRFGKLDESIKYCEKVLDKTDDIDCAYAATTILTVNYINIGDFSKAKEYMEKASKLQSKLTDDYSQKGKGTLVAQNNFGRNRS